MLELYRASAGSGKTYTLAKKYIWYYLTITPEGERTRLRSDAELADSARHILAVTFTNKATNEMQMRIVDALRSLAVRPPEYGERGGRPVIKSPEYMQDFIDDLGVSWQRIAQTSAKGLAILLENYSDFNVSTIDSFFQQVLRTFAYESEINDTYQVEIDGEYLSQVSVDATLEEIDQNQADTDTPFWVRTIMARTDKKWNMFANGKSSSKKDNPYSEFVKSVGRLDNEEYKLIRSEIEDYFDSGVDFRQLYADLVEKYETPVRQAFAEMRRVFRALYAVLPAELLALNGQNTLGKMTAACRKVLSRDKDHILKWNQALDSKDMPKLETAHLDHKKMKEWFVKNPEAEADIRPRAQRAIDALETWKSMLASPEFSHWRLYSVNLPYFALFGIVTRKRREYLDEMNALELSETSTILRGVIGDTDAPFVYEKLGTRLNHFLIDEFQDTSRLQWENLSPLLAESLSRDNGNLVIGDAKQSIYRFRNADPSLITTVVPESFGETVVTRGNDPSENTNYRSDLRVVQFNNSFFEYLVRRLDQEAAAKGEGRRQFGPLYANVVQTPNKTAPQGYVELRLSGDSKSKYDPEALRQTASLVAELIGRGYLQKEIAVLVKTNNEGEDVIQTFVEYNSTRPEGAPEIRFVSEQSLKIASSKAVRIILGVLGNMARGSNPKINRDEEERNRSVGKWSELMANFKYYSIGRLDIPLAERLDSFIEEGARFDALTELLSRMQSLAIPAIVEAVAAAFLPEELRRRDAVYLAAFQDRVLEYCENHPTDVASFLRWWERKSKSASISSPEDTDAVQVVTVHKSKGLQYRCVIVPFTDWDMADSIPAHKSEWRWVRPEVVAHDSLPMPPRIPVETSQSMAATSHARLLDEYLDMLKMDYLNSAYVALTRAERELYVFGVAAKAPKVVGDDDQEAGEKKKGGNKKASATTLGNYLYDFVAEAMCRQTDATAKTDPRLAGDCVATSDTRGLTVTIGTKRDDVTEGRKPQSPMSVIGDYRAVKSPSFLKYREEDLAAVLADDDNDAADGGEGAGEVDVDELDPRSEGNIKHAVLELVGVPSDLPHAVRHLQITGVVPAGMAASILASLGEALATPQARHWFDGSARVINERPVLKKGHVSRRPDRLLVYPDGHAEVVDYKFGRIDTSGKYRRQIGRYVSRLAETGRYTAVYGFIWYVNEGVVHKV